MSDYCLRGFFFFFLQIRKMEMTMFYGEKSLRGWSCGGFESHPAPLRVGRPTCKKKERGKSEDKKYSACPGAIFLCDFAAGEIQTWHYGIAHQPF